MATEVSKTTNTTPTPKFRPSKFDTGKIDFIGKTKIFVTISIILTAISIFEIFGPGLNYGIDFKGGTEIQIRFNEKMDIAAVRNFFQDEGIAEPTIQSFSDKNDFSVRFENVRGKTEKESNDASAARNIKVTNELKEKFKAQGVQVMSESSVGPQIGDQLKRNSLLAVFYCLLIIMIYVALRFDYNFAPGAVLCLFHDALITLGILVLLNREVNVQILAAILTIIGYSLNDTIVIYDRIRENLNLYKDESTADVINRSMNETLVRTIVTSSTTFLAVLALAIFAGGIIADFAVTMAIGIVFGTYSSIYVAAPLILLFDKVKHVGAVKTA